MAVRWTFHQLSVPSLPTLQLPGWGVLSEGPPLQVAGGQKDRGVSATSTTDLECGGRAQGDPPVSVLLFGGSV